MKPPGRALLYGRVSKADRSGKRESASVDQQLALGRRRAHSQGWRIVGELRDDGISASRFAGKKSRSDWQRAIELITDGACDVLVLWEVSRATRERMVYASLIAACMDAEVWIDVGGKLHDPSDPDDGFMLDLQAGLAVRESGITSKRIRRDVEARAQAGTPHGKLPYGYTRTYEQRTTGRVLLEQIPDPKTAPVVAELARRLLAGESAYSIAADFDRRGIPSPESMRAVRAHGPDAPLTPWRLETVRDLALSPTLAGLRVHRGSVIGPASWEPIISPADHAALTSLLRGRSAVRQHRPGTVQHLLSGLAECGVCGSPLRHMRNRGTPSYWCPGPARRGNGCVSRSKERLDAYVIAAVLHYLRAPDFVQAAAARQETEEGAAAVLAREIADLQAELNEYIRSAASRSGVARAAFERLVDDLAGQIEARQQRLMQAAAVPAAVLRFAGPDAERQWDVATLEEQRLVVRSVVRVVVDRSTAPRGSHVFDWRTVRITPRF